MASPHPVHSLAAPDKDIRRVGIEIEFLGLSAREAAESLARRLGGSIDAEDPHAYTVRDTRLGDMAVEMDLRHVHPQRRNTAGMIKLGPRSAALLGKVVSPVVPRELIVAPLPIQRIAEIDEAASILQAAGAQGSGVVLLDSLSMHFNVEPPNIDAATIAAYLKAFLILEPRLRREIARGNVRRMRVMPPEYPENYRRHVLALDYWPDMPTLISDYLNANPSRKRGLDLLPLFAHLDERRVRSVLPHEKIGPRPVFHYRLPQAHLGLLNWSIMPDWDRWLAVESLAANEAELRAKSRSAAPD